MSTPKYNNKLSGFQKNSKTLLVLVEDSSHNILNVTDYDASLYMQKYPIRTGMSLDVSIAQTSKSGADGAFQFDLTTSNLTLDAGDYLYEVIIDDGSTNRHTVIQDKFNLQDSIL